MPRIDVGKLKFHAQQSGEGPDLVFVHGLTGDLSIWFLCGAFREFSATHRLTAYDLRGHGYSDAPAIGYTSEDHARDLLGVMDALGIERARLLGHSFGGVIATHAAVLAPGRVKAIILSDPYFPALRHLEDVSRWGHWQNFRKEAADAGVTLSDEHWYDLGKFFDQVKHLDDGRMLRLRQAVGLPGLNRLLRLAETTCGDDAKRAAGLTADAIAGVGCPSLALFGEHSPFLATADYLADRLPGCRLRLVPGARHRAPEENPEGFLAAVRDFLGTLEPASEAARAAS